MAAGVTASAAGGAAKALALPENVELSELPNGVRVVTEAVPSVRSVALGLWTRGLCLSFGRPAVWRPLDDQKRILR